MIPNLKLIKEEIKFEISQVMIQRDYYFMAFKMNKKGFDLVVRYLIFRVEKKNGGS